MVVPTTLATVTRTSCPPPSPGDNVHNTDVVDAQDVVVQELLVPCVAVGVVALMAKPSPLMVMMYPEEPAEFASLAKLTTGAENLMIARAKTASELVQVRLPVYGCKDFSGVPSNVNAAVWVPTRDDAVACTANPGSSPALMWQTRDVPEPHAVVWQLVGPIRIDEDSSCELNASPERVTLNLEVVIELA